MDKDTSKLVEGGVVPETIQVLKNLVAVLEAAGSSVENVVKTTIFVLDMGDFAVVNEEYRKGKIVHATLSETCSTTLLLYRFYKAIGLSHTMILNKRDKHFR